MNNYSTENLFLTKLFVIYVELFDSTNFDSDFMSDSYLFDSFHHQVKLLIVI